MLGRRYQQDEIPDSINNELTKKSHKQTKGKMPKTFFQILEKKNQGTDIWIP